MFKQCKTECPAYKELMKEYLRAVDEIKTTSDCGRVKHLEQQLEQARECLRFYADEFTYIPVRMGENDCDELPLIEEDEYGKKARQCLKDIGD